MKLRVLGSGTLVPDAARASAGIAILDGEDWWQFDLGRAVLQRACEAGLDPLRLRHLQLTHWHPDHCCDLVPLLFALHYAPSPPRTAPLELSAPPGFDAFFEQLVRAWRWLLPETFELHIHEREPGAFSAGRATIHAVPLAHGSMPNLGYRLELGGHSVAYTGDTGPCPGLLSLADRVDILVSECSFPDARATATHLSPEALGRVAAESRVGRLVVTHVYPGLEPDELISGLGTHYAGPIDLAHDGLTIDL